MRVLLWRVLLFLEGEVRKYTTIHEHYAVTIVPFSVYILYRTKKLNRVLLFFIDSGPGDLPGGGGGVGLKQRLMLEAING